MTLKNKYIILLLYLLFANALQAQVSEYNHKAAFIERFTRFIEWPNSIERDTFKLAVIGKTPLKATLSELFIDLKIKGHNVELIYTNNLNDLTKVNLIFISKSEKKRINEILAFTDKYPILTIGDSKGFCDKGVHINMYVDDNYIRYEINQDAIEKSDLKVSSQLLSSAKIIKSND
ncbi:MAG: YfiR family protein [Bacteroidetes bacterium]|nr:YfiR family protein [Bacteroidota bacterium]